MKTESLTAICATIFAASCTAPVAKGDFVPIRQLLQETAATPYECEGYEARSGTCEGSGKMEIRNGLLVSSGTAAIAGEDGRALIFDVTTYHQIEDGRLCGSGRLADVSLRGVPETEVTTFVSEMLRAGMTAVSNSHCAAYYRTADGYFVEATTRDGKVEPELSGPVTFHADLKPVRPMAL